MSDEGLNRQQADMVSRLRVAIKNGGGYTAVAEKSGISGNSLNRYLKGYEMKVATAIHLAEICGVSASWLILGEGESIAGAPDSSAPSASQVRSLTEILSTSDVINFQNYDVKLSAGYGADGAQSHENTTISIPSAFLPASIRSKPRNICAATAKGDSMQPTIDDGDLLLIKRDVDTLTSGSVYALRIENNLLVKRLILKTNGNVQVVSDNPRYPAEELNADEIRQMIQDGGAPAKIIGRVIWRAGSMVP